ncbi:hypothetical protein [uncultured Pseudodesulfovibrio sp.]|uniref:hypothetical protein n=1 Tax=uncultured Pseudodesulfovibrio sp. TaxID=2035858 RepID=UPI0029C84D73|nr:hypothetical protein [uncultured Pseudodesulfovibrio sp.]
MAEQGIVFDKKINLANIVSILGSFAIVIAFGVSLSTRVEFLECQVKDNSALKTEMVQVRTEVRGAREDIQELKEDVKTIIKTRN